MVAGCRRRLAALPWAMAIGVSQFPMITIVSAGRQVPGPPAVQPARSPVETGLGALGSQ
jgi:hypothetical protein